MSINENDIFICDFCGEDVGKFNQETGNHPQCEELAAKDAELSALRERVEVEQAKKELLEKLVKIVYEKLKKDIELVSGVGCEWELGVMESIDAYFEMPAP